MSTKNSQDVTQHRWRGMKIGAVGFMIASFGFALGYIFEIQSAFIVVVAGVAVGAIGVLVHFVQVYS